ncbi:MBL fold metallo-hydrolase [Deinococcus rubellus]|uniref:MBL fold metallo-hydrolase n=1 Tax=Deinococcus rubellus TaxID=1889240 RepID=A0ABY5YCW9_9DEIO|nr:MBL fold metallo-hydrolase [Deinococcus rubellus]UWX62853.1 MBL fold metallo-hydrolase [Deinococcus rubellus]
MGPESTGELGAGANLIDLNFMGVPGSIASYVFDTGDGLALVDTGPSTTLPALEGGLQKLGAALSDVRHILLTHIHLDHAGAAGSLAQRLPRASVYVHERGAKHLTRPERLIASAGQIYGDQMGALWGEMLPIPAERLTVLRGGEHLAFSGLPGGVDVHYTPGHAVHHVSYHSGDDLYVGDVGGIRIALPQSPRPPTPPPDIDLAAWQRSIALLRALPARRLHLAHFGCYVQSASHWDGLLLNIATDAARVGTRLEAGEDLASITRTFSAELQADLDAEAPGLADKFVLVCPPWMSVQGLARSFQQQAEQPQTGQP